MTESHDLSFALEAQSPFQSGSSATSSSSEKAERNTRAFDALIYAVYYAAASSIAGDGAPSNLPFGTEAANHSLAAEYKRAAELALEDADFVQNETLETLQAMVLLLVNNIPNFVVIWGIYWLIPANRCLSRPHLEDPTLAHLGSD
jgi:hypothetical protein